MLITNKDILNVIGPKIKKARKEKGYTQKELAQKLNISADLIRNIENCRNIGSLVTLLNICNVLDITPNFLFSDLMENKSVRLDTNLYDLTSQIPQESKDIFKKIVDYLDTTY